jgi:hypothetical protein
VEGDAHLGGALGEACREQVAVAGFIERQAQPTNQLVLGLGEARLGGDAALGVEQFVGHPVLLQYRDISLGRGQLLLAAEQLQRAALASVVLDAGLVAQLLKALAAVVRQAHHAALVDGVTRCGAVAQHLRHPGPHRRVEPRPYHQGRMLREQPLQCLEGDPRRGPGGRVTGRDLASVGVAGLEGGSWLPVEDRHLVALVGKVVGAGDADDATAQNDYVHAGFLRLNPMGVGTSRSRSRLVA